MKPSVCTKRGSRGPGGIGVAERPRPSPVILPRPGDRFATPSDREDDRVRNVHGRARVYGSGPWSSAPSAPPATSRRCARAARSPGLVEADDDGACVLEVPRRRAGAQGRSIAEVVAGELARALGFAVPELTVAALDPAIGRAEPDPEIQDLLLASAGENLGVDFLPGALPFNAGGRSGAGPGAGGGRRLARRARDQRRPHAAQHQPACSGTTGCGSSTTARRCTSTTPTATRRRTRAGPLLGAIGRARAAALVREPRSRRPTSGWRRGSRASCWRTWRAAARSRLVAQRRRSRHLRRLPFDRAARGAAHVRRGAKYRRARLSGAVGSAP